MDANCILSNKEKLEALIPKKNKNFLSSNLLHLLQKYPKIKPSLLQTARPQTTITLPSFPPNNPLPSYQKYHHPHIPHERKNKLPTLNRNYIIFLRNFRFVQTTWCRLAKMRVFIMMVVCVRNSHPHYHHHPALPLPPPPPPSQLNREPLMNAAVAGWGWLRRPYSTKVVQLPPTIRDNSVTCTKRDDEEDRRRRGVN